MGGRLLPLNISIRPSLRKPLSASSSLSLYKSSRGYSEANEDGTREFVEERAPSTAEEFKKMAEEKLREAQQGVGSQTVEKASDAIEEATLGDSKLEPVKRKYEEHEEGADYRKRGDDPDGVKAFSNKA